MLYQMSVRSIKNSHMAAQLSHQILELQDKWLYPIKQAKLWNQSATNFQLQSLAKNLLLISFL